MIQRLRRWWKTRRFTRRHVQARGAELDLLARELFGAPRLAGESDAALRARLSGFCSPYASGSKVAIAAAASRVLRVRVATREEAPGWLVIVARKPWWRRRSTWCRMLADAQSAAYDVCPAGADVEVRDG